MSVFNPRYRKLIVEAARDLMAGCRTDDGAIDKTTLEAEIREHLFGNLKLVDWDSVKDEALNFTIHEYVKWRIRNTRPSGSFKGEAGRRRVYQVPNKAGRDFTAKPWEALTEEDLEAVQAYHELALKSRIDELTQITGAVADRRAQAKGGAA